MHDSPIAAAIGAVVTFHEDEYEYGIGPLRIRIDRIEMIRRDRGWAVVHGTEVDFRGQDRRVRQVTVPLAALIRALPSADDE